MKYIQCPDSLTAGDLRNDCLFLAGGISGCGDWQTEMKNLLKSQKNLVVVNPRRINFDKTKISDLEQISWERIHLTNCNLISFWFPEETVCPITLFDLGYCVSYQESHPWPLGGMKVFYGCHPNYSRISDVKTQILLSNKNSGQFGAMATSIEDLTNQVISHINRER